ncbi:unnamed protein product [Coccothraustes coccothraustes]
MTPALSSRRGATWWRGRGDVGPGAALIRSVTSPVWRQRGDVTHGVIPGVVPVGLRGARAPLELSPGAANWAQTVLEDGAPSSVLASKQKLGHKAEAELLRVRSEGARDPSSSSTDSPRHSLEIEFNGPSLKANFFLAGLHILVVREATWNFICCFQAQGTRSSIFRG